MNTNENNPPQVEATLESIAHELRRIGDAQDLLGNRVTGKKCFELAEAISAHARKSQGVNERLVTACKYAKEAMIEARNAMFGCAGSIAQTHKLASNKIERSAHQLGNAEWMFQQGIAAAESAASGENLEAELVELKRDKERLDWLESNGRDIGRIDKGSSIRPAKQWCVAKRGHGGHLREAIDDARKTEGAK